MSMLEVMAAGIPVVSTDVGGVRWLIHPETEAAAGFVVPAGNSTLIAEKILILLEDEEMCEEMGIHGRNAAEQYFSLETCINAHVKVYQCSTGV